MNRQSWLVLFAVALLADIAGISLQANNIQLVAKPLIVISLIGYFISATKTISSSLKKWIVFALCFSLLGDILLMLPDKDGLFFLFGLSAFLIAHIFYIIFFHLVRIKEAIKSKILPVVIVAVYYLSLITLLSPSLGDMKLPVRIYGIVISIMFMLAMHIFFLKNKMAGRFMLIGALFFVISDSLLAINKFYQAFEPAGILIMVTYGLAQFLIAIGAVAYLHSVSGGSIIAAKPI